MLIFVSIFIALVIVFLDEYKIININIYKIKNLKTMKYEEGNKVKIRGDLIKHGRAVYDFSRTEFENETYTKLMPEEFSPNKTESRFEVGKWYKIKNHTTDYYIKVIKLGEMLEADFMSIGSNLSSSPGRFYLNEITESKLLNDLSEIQQYLPSNHKDRIKSNYLFKKDQYIVILDSSYKSDSSFPINYCYKQKIDCNYLKVYKDACNEENGWIVLCRDNSSFKWRLATSEEISQYDKLGRSFDINSLSTKTKDLSLDEFLKEAKRRYPIGTKVKSAFSEDIAEITNSNFECNIKGEVSWNSRIYVCYGNKWGEIMSKSKEKNDSLKKEDLVKGEVYFYSKDSWDNDYIELYDGNKYPYIRINKSSGGLSFYGSYYPYSGFCGEAGFYCRKATFEEKDWLLKCIKEDKLVDKDIKKSKSSKLTSLPEKWCIKITKDTIDSINEFRRKYGIFSKSPFKLGEWKYFESVSYIGSNSTNINIFIEITFDEFKRWVLEEDMNYFQIDAVHPGSKAFINPLLKPSKYQNSSFNKKLELRKKVKKVKSKLKLIK